MVWVEHAPEMGCAMWESGSLLSPWFELPCRELFVGDTESAHALHSVYYYIRDSTLHPQVYDPCGPGARFPRSVNVRGLLCY